MGSRRRGLVGALAILAAASLGLAACDDDSQVPLPAPATTPTATAPTPVLKVGVWGTQAELAAYHQVVDNFNARTDEADARLVTYPNRAALLKAVVNGSQDKTISVPDVFLTSRDDLALLQDDDLVTPLDTLLDDRGVDLGDGYSRTAVEAFSSDRRLQCMPYGVSPDVVYFNTDLVDFARMRARGLPIPDSPSKWTLDEFAAAASFASRPRRGTKGIYVPPTIDGLAPFIYSGGGHVYDDDEAPASLDFSDSGTRDALQRILEVLRDPTVTLSEKQLTAHPAEWWFEHGKLGMITGNRSLTPALRNVSGLRFDVMPIPILDTFQTVGDVTGFCLSSGTQEQAQATDLLVHLISSDSVSDVVRAGSLVPANQLVALSDRFVQPTRQPLHSPIFTGSIRAMRLSPLFEGTDALQRAVGPSLEELIDSGPILDLDDITTQIDEESRTVLDPDGDGKPGVSTPSPSPSG